MTLLGKILIFVNLAFAVAAAAWAFGIYSNRVDFSNAAAKGELPAGELAKREARIKQLTSTLGVAESRLRAARTELLTLQAQRPFDRTWYDAQLLAAQVGVNGQTKTPITTVVVMGGQIVPDPKNMNRPTMAKAVDREGKETYSIAYYTNELATTHAAIAREQQGYQKALKEDADLTALIIGPKGLRQRLFDEETKRASVEDEIVDLRPQLINGMVEAEILAQRQAQLEQRVQELKKTP